MTGQETSETARDGAGNDSTASGTTGRQEPVENGADVQTLTTELAQARQEAQEHYDRLLRLAAEFENYKKRMEREQQNTLKFAEENLVRELLPTIDNLERAVEQEQTGAEPTALLQGVEMTVKGLLDTLAKYGVRQVESVGKAFDPNFHEALVMEASAEIPANHILREFQKGYFIKERLLRPAKVIVSSGPGG
ncbi:MAG: nucleotide exchange factor GrpE [Thermodesulfobacteriota bacterium]